MTRIKGFIHKACERWDKDVYINELPRSYNFNGKLDILLSKFENKTVLIRWAVARKPFECIDTELYNQMYGISSVEYNDFSYSEVSSSTYTCNVVGGHNLTEWLSNYNNYYIIIEVKEVV